MPNVVELLLRVTAALSFSVVIVRIDSLAAKRMVEAGLVLDTAETVKVSSLALLKMLRHAYSAVGKRSESNGFLQGEFIDDYTIHVVDVIPMPDLSFSIAADTRSVNTTVVPVALNYKQKMHRMLRETDRYQIIVGWYNSPTSGSTGLSLSPQAMRIQKELERVNARAIGIVLDPTATAERKTEGKSGEIVMDCFRTVPINESHTNADTEVEVEVESTSLRQITSIGAATIAMCEEMERGVMRSYYSLNFVNMGIGYSVSEKGIPDEAPECRMLRKCNPRLRKCDQRLTWTEPLRATKKAYSQCPVVRLLMATRKWHTDCVCDEENDVMNPRMIAKQQLLDVVTEVLGKHIQECFDLMLAVVVF